jgi:large subunit ribosomal protein L6e
LQQARKTIRPTSLRESLKPGTVLILLAGRFRGKRVVLLNSLDQGVLLVTGPFKVNGVPIRRVNARYVIATSTVLNIKSIDKELVKKLSGKEYFAREKGEKKTGEDAFFKQGDKPEVSNQCLNMSKNLETNICVCRRRRSQRPVWTTRSPSTSP